MIDFENKLRYDVFDLRKLMSLLRSPEGCPWDCEQTHESIRRNLLEEAYEAASAIDDNNADDLQEELGDILMQVAFHADIAESGGRFSFEDVVDATCKKLIRRHPHVFKDVNVKNGEESLLVWDEIKREEKKQETTNEAMSSVARSLPALWRAEKIQKKAAKTGFDWPEYSGAVEALRSELLELERAIDSISRSGNKGKISPNSEVYQEIGDLLFSVVNVARFFDIDPEDALNSSSSKFISRFKYIEDKAEKIGKKLSDMTLSEMEEIYQEAKLEK